MPSPGVLYLSILVDASQKGEGQRVLPAEMSQAGAAEDSGRIFFLLLNHHSCEMIYPRDVLESLLAGGPGKAGTKWFTVILVSVCLCHFLPAQPETATSLPMPHVLVVSGDYRNQGLKRPTWGWVAQLKCPINSTEDSKNAIIVA